MKPFKVAGYRRSYANRPLLDSASQSQSRFWVAITALGAGVVNIVGGGVALKAWIFNAGQIYYDSLFRAFWLPEGVLQLPDATITAAGYAVLRNSTEIWALAAVLAPPIVVIATLITYPFVTAAERILSRSIGSFRISSETKRVLERAYSLLVLGIAVAWLSGVVWLGLYNYPRAAHMEGIARHKNLMEQMANGCAKCPLWGEDNVAGVAIVVGACNRSAFCSQTARFPARIV